ncbi:hypothetical protein [Paraglaciecola marina]|uniref:hypothetical protein n=1 Tax=Paraglaciecola marina TaxID=2500157 RepID=UPI00105BE5CD|nr:hypothetical protein [Paraglaciecola marina]
MLHSATYQDNSELYYEVSTTSDECGSVDSNEYLLVTHDEYQEFTFSQAGLGAGDSVTLTIALICALSGFLGFRAGNAFQ